MFGSIALIGSLLLSIHILLCTTASIPRSDALTNDDSTLMTSTNIFKENLSLAATSVRFSYRDVLFNVTYLGVTIPKSEVSNLLASADEAITDLVDQAPLDSIPSNRFEHRAPSGNTLISIQAHVGETITWTLLSHVLQGLYRFMLGLGVQQQHCQQIDFTVAHAWHEIIGLGVILYFPPRESQVQRRETAPTSISLSNETSTRISNESNLLSASGRGEPPFDWDIPGTSLILRFHFLGMPIPKAKVIELLQGAIAQARLKATGGWEEEDIENGVYDRTLPSNGDGTRTGITILAYQYKDITWEQLLQTLTGLYQFITAFGVTAEQHYQTLGFRISDRHEVAGPLSTGSLSFYPQRAGRVQKRARSASQGSLQFTNLTLSAPNATGSESTIRP